MLTHFSLFSGIGGIDLAAEWAGFQTVGQCEFADYPTKVLEKHWPDVPRWRDVRDVTAESIRERGIGEITLLSGGFPCQPHSVAGKRQASADVRDLWPEFRRVIGEVTPKWILGENVPGLLTSDDRRFFGRILFDLASLGYAVGWATYGANDIGAPHKRERVFIVANTTSEGLEGLWEGRKITRDVQQEKFPGDSPYGGEAIWGKNESEILRMVDGFSDRVHRVKALGNAVVPQQVYPILKAIAEIVRAK